MGNEVREVRTRRAAVAWKCICGTCSKCLLGDHGNVTLDDYI